jgi:Ser-tRNA(Ala) deacylase AlaX
MFLPSSSRPTNYRITSAVFLLLILVDHFASNLSLFLHPEKSSYLFRNSNLKLKMVADTTEDMCLPPTNMLYMTYEGNWLTECSAQVLGFKRSADSDMVEVYLDQSVLHAQGGGQPTDTGSITGVTGNGGRVVVEKVLMDRTTGITTHTGSLQDTDQPLVVGDTVKVTIDAENRRILSECHTAGHVVDSAMARCGKFLQGSKAYHFLDGPYVEYKGTIAVDEREGVLKNLQSAFCQLVDENINTTIDILSKEEANAVCNKQGAQHFDMDVFADKKGQVRVVAVAGFPCPCGGTHVRSTADLKERQWGVTGIRCKKGVVRIRYGQNTTDA